MPEGIKRDALIRYNLLRQLLTFCERTVEGDNMRWKFKCSVRDNDKFIQLMEKFDRRFSCGIIKNKKCHKELWKKLSYILKNHYCIVHKNDEYRTKDERYIIISFNSDSSLV